MELVERGEELTRLTTLVERARRGEGAMVLVSGEAGIGKTSLTRELVRRAPERTRVWWGACDPLATPPPLGPLEDVALDDVVMRTLLEIEEPHRLRREVLAELAQPTVLVVEDVHWADEATVELLVHLGRRVQGTRSVVLVTFRPDDAPGGVGLGRLASAPGVEWLSLHLLSADGVAAMVGASDVDVGRVHAVTGGNPLLVREFVAHGAQGVPAPIQANVAARLEVLPASAREVLDLVAGSPVPVELGTLARARGGDVDTDVAAAVGSGLVAVADHSVSFHHALLRDAALAATDHARRTNAHRALLEVLVATHGLKPARISHHAAGAGDAQRLHDWSLRAADAAADRGADREAADHLGAALDADVPLGLRQRAELLDRITIHLTPTSGSDDRMLARRREAAAAWAAVGEPARQAYHLARLSWDLMFAGADQEGDGLFARALELVRGLPDDEHTLEVRAQQLAQRLELAPSLDGVARAREMQARAEAVGASEAEVEMAVGATALLARFAQLEDVERSERLALDLVRREQYMLPEGVLRINVAEALVEVRRHAAACSRLDALDALAAAHDWDAFASYSVALRARVAVQSGAWDEADRLLASILRGGSFVDKLVVGMAEALAAILRARRGLPVDDEWVARLRDRDVHRRDVHVAWLEALALAESTDAGEVGPLVGPAIEHALSLAEGANEWLAAELGYHACRLGVADRMPDGAAEPWRALAAGEWEAAAHQWGDLDSPYERAHALAMGDVDAQLEALHVYERLGAVPAADRLRAVLREAGLDGVPARQRAADAAGPLTGRQAEVLALVAQGASNAEIAERLVISVKTAGHHVSAILRRLGARSRTEAVAVARRDGLLSA